MGTGYVCCEENRPRKTYEEKSPRDKVNSNLVLENEEEKQSIGNVSKEKERIQAPKEGVQASKKRIQASKKGIQKPKEGIQTPKEDGQATVQKTHKTGSEKLGFQPGENYYQLIFK